MDKQHNDPTWHVVTSQGPIILGVFGEALLAEAQACAAKIERQTGSRAFVQQVRGERPHVGQSTLAWGVDAVHGSNTP